MKKLNQEKVKFIRLRGYQSYRKLYYMCKFFEGTVDKILTRSIEEIDELLK